MPQQGDKVIISDLVLYAKIGWTAAERKTPQRLALSLEVSLDLRAAAASRSLTDTICYSRLSRRLSEIAAGNDWVLIEELAEALCGSVLSENSHISAIKLLLKKFSIPDASWTGVEITRCKE